MCVCLREEEEGKEDEKINKSKFLHDLILILIRRARSTVAHQEQEHAIEPVVPRRVQVMGIYGQNRLGQQHIVSMMRYL